MSILFDRTIKHAGIDYRVFVKRGAYIGKVFGNRSWKWTATVTSEAGTVTFTVGKGATAIGCVRETRERNFKNKLGK